MTTKIILLFLLQICTISIQAQTSNENVTIIPQIVNYILEKPTEDLDIKNADYNHDGIINVTDIVGIIGPGLESLSLIDKNGNEYTPFLWLDSEINIYIPHKIELNSLQVIFHTNGLKVYHNGRLITSEESLDFSDFANPVKLDVVLAIGTTKTYTIKIYDLPVLSFHTPDKQPITSKTIRTEGCKMQLIDAEGKNVDLGEANIRGRGNTSWLLPKIPYNIKLAKKHDILGMKSSKHWILLANAFYDRTQLHNATAFEMARLTDFPWVQSGRFVELFVNNVHQGLYYLCEKIRVEKGKIDITEIKPSDLSGEELTGGYFLESVVGGIGDGYIYTDYFNKTGRNYEHNLGWEIKHPEEDIADVQWNYIHNYLSHMEKLIFNEDSLAEGTYRDFFDIETAINWWLVEEASLNEEATRTKNVYLYKDRNDKIKIGPPWDFDAYTFGLYGTSHFYCTKRTLYFEKLFKDTVFVERLKEKWATIRSVWLDKIPQFIDEQYDLIHRSAERNEIMWPDYCEESHATEKTFHQSIEEMKDAIVTQIEWMDKKISENYFVDWWDEKNMGTAIPAP